MLRAGRSFALTIALVLTGTAAAVRAQDAAPAGSLSQIPVPGGLRAALAVLGDRAAPDRSQFLLEFIRRTYDMPLMSKGDSREVARQALVAHLDAASRATEPAGARAPDSLPLPLPPAIWIDVVFGGRAAPATLVQSIAGSREASLLYYGLMSLDEETRAWVGGDRSLIADLATRHAAAFAVAAPGLRVSAGLVRVPGGKAAEPAWEALVGRSPGDAAGFTRALLAPGSGDLPFLLASIAHLTPPQIEFALNLQAPDPSDRVAAARRLREAFAAVAWRVEQRTFWRPPLDPALLIADLETDENGRPILPGTEAFWTAAFAGGDPGHVTDTAVPGLAAGEPVDVGWLCNEIFTADFTDRRSRYDLVLFASRALRHVTAANSLDALSTLRAARAFPALVGTLERSRVADLTTFAAAARRASLLSAIDDGARAARALRQYQGILSILTRAAQRGGLASASLPDAVLSLSRVELSRGGQYEGRLVRWLIDFVDAHERNVSTAPASASMVDAVVQTVGGPFDRAVLRLAAGFSAAPPRVLTWEGTRYRVDHAAAEAIRLARLLGDGYPPYLASARQLVEMADALVAPGVTREMLRRHAADLHMLGRCDRVGSLGRSAPE